MELKEYLKTQFNWENRKIISNKELMDIFYKANYKPTSKLVEFLTYFYNARFEFKQEKKVCDIDFRLKKVLEDHPFHLQDQYLETLNVTNVVPFGEIQRGHMVLLADDQNNIYGVYDDFVKKLGNDYYRMLDDFYKSSLV